MMWSWIPSNWSEILSLTRANAFLGIVSPLIGVATFDQLRDAIQAAEGSSRRQARQVQHAQQGPPT